MIKTKDTSKKVNIKIVIVGVFLLLILLVVVMLFFHKPNGNLSSEITIPRQNQQISPSLTIKQFPTNNPTVGENVSQPGEHCGGFIMHPKTCPQGFHCQLGHIPDTGGVCVAN